MSLKSGPYFHERVAIPGGLPGLMERSAFTAQFLSCRVAFLSKKRGDMCHDMPGRNLVGNFKIASECPILAEKFRGVACCQLAAEVFGETEYIEDDHPRTRKSIDTVDIFTSNAW